MVAEDDRVAVRWVARATAYRLAVRRDGDRTTRRRSTVPRSTASSTTGIAEDWEVMNEGVLRDQLASEPSATA